MGSTIIKPTPDDDFYVDWSSIVEAPIAWGPRDWMIPYLYDREDRKPDRIPPHERPEARLDRVDQLGTSARWPSLDRPFGGWDDTGWIYQQEGILPRHRLLELCDRLAADENAKVTDLLEAFGD